MHYKTKQKLSTATKLYAVVREGEYTTEIKIQLPYGNYVSIFLNEPKNQKIVYRELKYGGFNYDPTKDTPIYHYRKKQIIKILQNSKNYRSNDSETIDMLIELLGLMSDYI